jgi:hypothetical protein
VPRSARTRRLGVRLAISLSFAADKLGAVISFPQRAPL